MPFADNWEPNCFKKMCQPITHKRKYEELEEPSASILEQLPNEILAKIFLVCTESAERFADVAALRLTCKSFHALFAEHILSHHAPRTVVKLWTDLADPHVRNHMGLAERPSLPQVSKECRELHARLQEVFLSAQSKIHLWEQLEERQSKRRIPCPDALLYSVRVVELSDSLGPWIDQQQHFFSRLRMLYLAKSHLSFLPAEIAKLPQLQTLGLQNNNLRALPQELGLLTQLTSLNASHNQLKVLPEALGQCVQLQSLYLYHNQLTCLPPHIGALNALECLDVSDNALTVLPEEIAAFSQLTALYASGNALTELTPMIGKLHSLDSLSLYDNALTSLPKEIGELKQLRILQLANNRLSSLPPAFAELKSLRWVNLSGNQFSSFPSPCLSLTELSHLNLAHNAIPSLPEEIDQCSSLTVLNVAHNPLGTLSHGLCRIKTLTTFEFSTTVALMANEDAKDILASLSQRRVRLFPNDED